MTYLKDDQRIFFKVEKHNPLRTVLVVMKDYEELKEVCAWLKLENFHIITERNGKDALERYRNEPTAFIISDWDLPTLNGVRLCQQIRNINYERSPYIILAATEIETKQLSAGFFAGADEFILKPLLRQVLHARMHSGLRILKLQDNLINKNEELNEANEHLSNAYRDLDDDLRAAGKLQQTRLPAPYKKLDNCEIATAIKPLTHIGGDVIGHFPLSEDIMGIYAIDVMGHSVSSALLGFMIEQSLNPYDKTSNPAFERMSDGTFRIREPHELLALLNEHHKSEDNSDFYFTMSYAQVNCKTGAVKLALAGQPQPVIIGRDQSVSYIGESATPIGIHPNAKYQTNHFQMESDEQLLLYSDGLIEACDIVHGDCDQTEFSNFIKTNFTEKLDHFSDLLFKNLLKRIGRGKFQDDISAIIIKPSLA